MILESFPDKYISAQLRATSELESAKHIPSGKLSASMLGQPLQWQVLKTLGVGKKEFDDYTLRKFVRGNSVEEWLLTLFPNVVSTQHEVEYRGVVGLVDAMIDTTGFDYSLGIIPYEIKSVANAKYKRISMAGSADHGHKLQAGLYALATGADQFAVCYVASDDYRILNFTYSVGEIKDEIDGIITAYDEQMKAGVVPAFKAKEKWQENAKYNQYPDWVSLTEAECQMAINYHYPTAWDDYQKKGQE